MSPAEQARYRDAVAPWVKLAERTRSTITHVRYRDGSAAVTLERRGG
jgi:hypothetical protein